MIDHFNYGPFDQAGGLCESPCSNLHETGSIAPAR